MILGIYGLIGVYVRRLLRCHIRHFHHTSLRWTVHFLLNVVFHYTIFARCVDRASRALFTVRCLCLAHV